MKGERHKQDLTKCATKAFVACESRHGSVHAVCLCTSHRCDKITCDSLALRTLLWMDLGGAITYAQFQFLKREATLTHLTWQWQDFVEGLYLQLTNSADTSRTFAAIHMHENRLYIVEATVPKGAPEPGLFQQSMGFVNEDGSRIRYQTVYSNLFPAPPRARGIRDVTGGGRNLERGIR